MSEVVAYLCVFDRYEFNTHTVEPHEAFPARFETRDGAVENILAYQNRTPEEAWTIYKGSVPHWLKEGDKIFVNPRYEAARFELRVVLNKNPSTDKIS